MEPIVIKYKKSKGESERYSVIYVSGNCQNLKYICINTESGGGSHYVGHNNNTFNFRAVSKALDLPKKQNEGEKIYLRGTEFELMCNVIKSYNAMFQPMWEGKSEKKEEYTTFQ